MTTFEMITTVLSLSAVGVSLYALLAQRALQKENNELQRANAELSKKQLELLARDDCERAKARIQLSLVKTDRLSYKFVLRNVGGVAARSINMALQLDNHAQSPLIESDVKEKLPAPVLQPGGSFSLIAALGGDTPLSYRAILSWINPDGSRAEEETFVSV